MTEAEKRYLSILADYCNNRTTAADPSDNPENWSEIIDYADAHATSGIIWKQCSEILMNQSIAAADRVHNGFLQDVLKYNCAVQDFREVSAAMEGARIPFLVLKGARVRGYYPEPALRTMSDIDILIREQDRDRSDRLMKEMGFYETVGNREVWIYDRDLVTYEFHSRMMYETLTTKFDYAAYFDRVWEHTETDPGTGRVRIEASFHFLYLLVHIAKHVVHAGMGFRSFMDLVFVSEHEKDRIDWDWLQKELEIMELTQFAGTCAALCKYWFDKDLPLKSRPLTSEFTEKATAKVMGDGIFGRKGGRNKEGYAAKDIRRSDLPYWLEAIRIMIRRAFPSYSDMRIIPWYSFLDNRPWLLPVAWIYRWFRALTRKPVSGTHTLFEPIEKKKEIEQRQKYLEGWGL